MNCPFCRGDSRVVDSREVEDGAAVRRRRECTSTECGQRFTTFERAEIAPRMVIKKDGSREMYQRDKILRGMVTACEKRQVSVEQLSRAVEDIEAAAFNGSRLEVESMEIGEHVSSALRDLDQVAYVRFTSVYREFADIREFEQALRNLRGKDQRGGNATGSS